MLAVECGKVFVSAPSKR
jgi:hypothetical protein